MSDFNIDLPRSEHACNYITIFIVLFICAELYFNMTPILLGTLQPATRSYKHLVLKEGRRVKVILWLQ